MAPSVTGQSASRVDKHCCGSSLRCRSRSQRRLECFFLDEPFRSIKFERQYVIAGAITLDHGNVPHLGRKVLASTSPKPALLVFDDGKLACESQGAILCIRGIAVRVCAVKPAGTIRIFPSLIARG
jgi:hypothetical protein